MNYYVTIQTKPARIWLVCPTLSAEAELPIVADAYCSTSGEYFTA